VRYLSVVLLALFISFSPAGAQAQDNNNVSIGAAAIGAVVGAVALPLVAPVVVAGAAATYVAAAGVAAFAPITVSAVAGAVMGYFVSE
jgi:ABC-type transport system involved in cytochrome c biogenesis permease component